MADAMQVFREGGGCGGGAGACKAFTELVEGMTEGRLEELVEGLRWKTSDAGEACDHCKMIFSHKRTRDMGVLLCVQLLQGGKFSDKAAFRCVPEIRAAIIDCASVGGAGAGETGGVDEGDEEDVAEERVRFLTRLCSDILGFLQQDIGEDGGSNIGGSTGWPRVGGAVEMDGFIKALELLPSVLQGFENQATPGTGKQSTSGRERRGARERDGSNGEARGESCRKNGSGMNSAAVRTKVISDVLGSTWPASCVFPILRVLTEVSLTESEKAEACKHVVDSSTEIPEDHTIGLIEILLSTAEKYGDMRWLEAGRCVLERTPERLLGDAYCVVEISLHNGSRLMGLINSSLGLTDAGDDRKSRRGAVERADLPASNEENRFQLTVTDFYLMLIVAQNDLFRERVMDTMVIELVKLCSSGVGQSHVEHRGFQHAKKLLSEVVRLPEAEKYSCILLELGLRLVSEGSQGKNASSQRMLSTCVIGQHLLYDLFHWRTHVRSELIATIFNSLVENKNADSRFLAGCVHVLQRITASHLLSLRDAASTIAQCLSFLWLLPLAVARTLLLAFIPLCKHSQLFCDRIMVLFRKELYGSDVPKRRLAVYGVCQLLAHTERGVLCDPQQQIDAIVSLKPIFSSQLEVRVEVYEGLQSLLAGSKPNVGYSVLDMDAQNLMRELLISRMRRYLVETEESLGAGKERAVLGGESLVLHIEPCFEEIGAVGSKKLCCRESLSHLVKCIASIANVDDTAQAVMRALAAQLSCPSSVAALMTGHESQTGIRSDASGREQKGLSLTLSNRLMVILPLYEFFIDLCACSSPPWWAIPVVSPHSAAQKDKWLWLEIYSTLSAVNSSSAESDPSYKYDSGNFDKVLTSIERVCSLPEPPIDRKIARQRFLRLSPVTCRLIRRFLDIATHQEKFEIPIDDQKNDADMPSSSSHVHQGAQKLGTGSTLSELTPRFLKCVMYLFENTKPPLNAPSRRASRMTRSKAQNVTVENGEFSDCAPTFARKLAEQFQERTRDFDIDDFGFDEKSYHMMRDLLLESMRTCVDCGACSTKDVWNGLSSIDADEDSPMSIKVVEQLCSRLDAEIELGVVPLSTLLAYLDLIQAIQNRCPSSCSSSGHADDDTADWSKICRHLMSMLCRSCSTAPAQALRRVLTFSVKSLKSSTAVMLSVQVISHVCSSIREEHYIVEDPTDVPSSFMLKQLDWELPDLDSSCGISSAGVCLRHLCSFFSEPVNLDRPLSVFLHASTVVTEAFKVAGKIPTGTRALMIRLSRRILSHSTKITAALFRHEGLEKIVLHAALLFTRQALLGADVLCGTLPSEAIVGAAQIRHAAFKCGLQAKSLTSAPRTQALMSGGVVDVAHELESVLTSLKKSGGGAEIVLPEPGEAVAKTSRRKKRRIRSRNAYVDAALDEEDGSDGYGDLEDFIVCRDGTVY